MPSSLCTAISGKTPRARRGTASTNWNGPLSGTAQRSFRNTGPGERPYSRDAAVPAGRSGRLSPGFSRSLAVPSAFASGRLAACREYLRRDR